LIAANSSPLVRPFAATDRDTLADLWVEAWRATMPAIDFSGRRDWICARLDSQEESGTVTLCAQLPGELVGFAMIEPARNWLEQLVVTPARFGAGIGKTLLDAAKRMCPKALSLRVNQDNPRAARFYAREGFVVVASGTNPGGVLKTWDMTWRG
jgi:GNAT superfamily N-acetyltransferase